jgi:small-conductance mechanosensitive channel
MNFEWLDIELFSSGEYSLSLGQLLLALLILGAVSFASRMAQNAITRVASIRGSKAHLPQLYALNRFVHYAILVLGFLLALTIIGIDMSKLAIVAGALGIGIGLGLQNLVNNFVSGIVILLERSLKVGDFIELEQTVFGVVKQINFRSTLIRTNDNVDILIPNSQLVSNQVTNWTLEESHARFRIPFSVAYGSDKELVKKAVLEAASSVEYTLENAQFQTNVWFTSFGDSSLNFVLGVWVDYDAVIRPTGLRSEYLWAIDDAFRRYGIEIPFPQRDVYIKHVPDRLKHNPCDETEH